jgi:hypothetical protein
LLDDERYHAAVEAAELYADGLADEVQLAVIREEIRYLEETAQSAAVWNTIQPDIRIYTNHVSFYTYEALWGDTRRDWTAMDNVESHKDIFDPLRDIFGHLFRSVTANPSWLTATVVSLAHGIYDDRTFDRRPILADALQDAGCDDEAVLTHCRSDGPHCRGCWVVDLLLGKE